MASALLTQIRKYQRCLLDRVVEGNPGLKLDERSELFVRLFENWLAPQSRILDIGGGWGFYAEPLRRRGHHLTVLDVVKPGFQKAPVVIYENARMPFHDQSFEASLLITMLHHVPDPEAILREALRVTQGVIVVVEDLYRHPAGRLWTQFRDQMFNFEFFGHPSQFKKQEEWTALFDRLGLKVLEMKNLYTWIAGLRILNGVFILQPSKV